MELESSTNQLGGESRFGDSLLVSTLAHEIRNPLQGIRIYLEEAQRGGSISEALKRIGENVTRLESVVDRMQKLSQTHQLQPESVNLTDLIQQSISSLGFWLDAAGVHVKVITRWEGPAQCSCDRELIQQVLLNLIMNAIQSMPQGGKMEIQIIEAQDFAQIEVADSGNGMSVETLRSLGTPFFTTKSSGNGLGVVFARTIAALHGGSLDYESKLGVGTKVTLRLPKTQGAHQEIYYV